MVLDLMPFLALRPPRERCVCNRFIAAEPYYGVQSVEAEEIVYIDPSHPGCMAEWSLYPDPDSALGVAHCRATEEADDDIRPV